jgi:anaerobic magnesium-protoporphyrin IX monomethyl ester cyclase
MSNLNGPIILVSKDILYTFPFGYAYLAGYLIDHGEKVEILYQPKKFIDFKEFARKIISLKPLLVGFGTLYPDLYIVREIIKCLKEEGCDFPLIIGGQMVTPTPEFALEITEADIGVIGEGEIILYELIKALRENKNLQDVKGIIFKKENKLITTEPGEFIKDMSLLPKVPYDLFPHERWLNIGQFYVGYSQPHWLYNDRVIAIHGGRGCPFNCNFCYHHSLPRYRKVAEMFNGIDELLEKYDANMLYFGDDLVLASPARAKELIQSIKNLKRKISYSVSCRFDILDRLDDETLKELKNTGCRIMGLGIESGSQRILDIIDKRITVEQIKKGLNRLKEVGILPTVSIMVGQYTETLEDVQKSADLMLETLKNDKNINYAFTICTPFPGTKLYDIALEKGLIKNHLDFYEKFNPVTDLGGLSINLSAMSDNEVIYSLNKLEELYSQEKKKLIGKNVDYIEKARYFIFRVYRKIDKTVINKFPDFFIFNLIKKAFHQTHKLVQLFLDKFRLYLYGIK